MRALERLLSESFGYCRGLCHKMCHDLSFSPCVSSLVVVRCKISDMFVWAFPFAFTFALSFDHRSDVPIQELLRCHMREILLRVCQNLMSLVQLRVFQANFVAELFNHSFVVDVELTTCEFLCVGP